MKRLRPTVAPTPENMAVDRMLTKHQQAFGRAYLAGDFLATTSDEDFAILLEIGSIDAKELDAKSPKAQTLLLLTIHLIGAELADGAPGKLKHEMSVDRVAQLVGHLKFLIGGEELRRAGLVTWPTTPSILADNISWQFTELGRSLAKDSQLPPS